MNETARAEHPEASTTRCRRALRWLVLGGFALMVPPTPLGTSLPPLSEWSKAASYDSADECERNRQTMLEAARRMVAADPNASALAVAGALGRLQARCVQNDDAPAIVPAPAPAAEPAPAKP
jgi:hypothetical protein